MPHSTHNRSFRRQVFFGNRLYNQKQGNETTHTPWTQKRNRKTVLS